MGIEVKCGKCAQRYAAPDTWAGRRTNCPKCGAPVTVPSTPPAAKPLDLLQKEDTGLLGNDLLADELASAPISTLPGGVGGTRFPSSNREGPPGFSGPNRGRGGPPVRRTPPDLNSLRQGLIDRYGSDKVVTIVVRNVPAGAYTQTTDQIRSDAGIDRLGFAASMSGGLLTAYLAPVQDVKALASRLTIGPATDVDVEQRSITITLQP